MAKPHDPSLKQALDIYRANVAALLALQQLSQAEGARRVKKKNQSSFQKTMNNVVQGRHSSRLGSLATIAATFDIPLWVMFVPNLPKELLQKPGVDRLDLLVKNYLACSDEDRKHAENIAAAYAGKKNHEK